MCFLRVLPSGFPLPGYSHACNAGCQSLRRWNGQHVHSLSHLLSENRSILAFSAIRCGFVNTVSDPIVPSVFPRIGLQLDALLPSAGSGAATVPRLHQYYGGAKTSRCPSRRASLPSLGDTMPAPVCSLLCFFGCPSAQARTLVRRRPSGSPVMETTRPPRFLGHPLHICSALRPRPGLRAKPLFSARRCCPRSQNDEGPNDYSFVAQ